jgi:phage repressor protein C with HTH and peptisase S24 domain
VDFLLPNRKYAKTEIPCQQINSKTGDDTQCHFGNNMVMSNLKQIRRAKGLTQRHVAQRVGVTEGTISKYEREDSRLSLPVLHQLTVALDTTIAAIAGEAPIKEDGDLEVDFAMIPVVDARASAGDGSLVGREQVLYHNAYRRQWLRQVTTAPPERLVVLEVSGDSMFPTVANGDHILVDPTKIQIDTDGIYVIRKRDTVHVKRITVNMGSDSVVIKSDNPAYATETVRPEDVEVIGRVVWLGRQV